ncbi:MAG TPA: hypothetical protein VKS22_14585 [Candidatus Binataceae bacterium]|nr:hypothetical protein [Candidatus Binataceae bacterium]
MRNRTYLTFRRAGALALLALIGLAAPGCNGFGTVDATLPGNTPPVSAQTVYRLVGSIGTPFVATISDTRSSWTLNGVVPLNIIIVNIPSPGAGAPGASRIVATKTTNDSRLLSVEILSGFGVADVASTFANYGTVVGGINQKLPALAPKASPDVRYYVKGPATAVFNAVIEDSTTAFALQSRVTTVILQDSPNGGSQSGHVDGIFNLVQDIGPLDIDLFFNGKLVSHAAGGGSQIVKVN